MWSTPGEEMDYLDKTVVKNKQYIRTVVCDILKRRCKRYENLWWTGDVIQQLANTSTHASSCCTRWLLRNEILTCLKIIRLLHKHSQTTPHTIKLFAQQPVLRKLFDRVWDPEGYSNILWSKRILLNNCYMLPVVVCLSTCPCNCLWS
jgi:hypothetical protein